MVRLTERDVRLMAKCAAARWLTTGQIQRMFFRDSTLDAVRKRLRKLSEDGYLRSSQPHRMAEMLHAVGRQGQQVLAEKGLKIKLGKVPDQVEHCIGINEIRLAVESTSWRVHYFFACWELGQFGWQHPVIPDAVFSVEAEWRMTFMVEFDRGTEGREVLQRKFRQYEGLLDAFGFNGVIVVAESEKLLGRLGDSLSVPRGFTLGLCGLSDLGAMGAEGRIFAEPGRTGNVYLADLACAPDER